MSAITIPRPTGLGAAIAAIGGLPRWILLLGGLLLAAFVAWAFVKSRPSDQMITAPVVTQTLVQSVTASGTVNPQNLISVGTQISGTISSIDVDYNSKVRQGQVLARLDPSTLEAQLQQAQAAVAQARAQVAQAADSALSAASGVGVASANETAEAAAIASATANAGKTQAALSLAQKTQARDAALLAQGYVAQSAVDADRAAVAQDRSDVAAAEAAVAQAQAQAHAGAATVSQQSQSASGQVASTQAAQANVEAAEAVVRQDELNLQHAVITSPVNGTVVARDVSVGQTVAASLQTPTLFSIAANLGKMEVDINVGEPDIGNVKSGDPVTFSVLAHPNETFHGTVAQVRINPQTLNNVVTYDVVVLANNTGGQLLPGMTANATIAVATAHNALTVPLTAIHTASAAPASPWGSAAGAVAGAAIAPGATGQLMVARNGKAVPTRVRVTLTNGTQAAITPLAPNALRAGDLVVIGWEGHQRSARAGAGTARSPMGASPVGGMRGIH